MQGDFPDRHREWQQAAERAKAAQESWKDHVRVAQKEGTALPIPPDPVPPEPEAPRLRQNDVTIEKVATLLASAAPKGLLIFRDEMAGWLGSMNQYNDAGRAFWIEAYGGRPYRVERQKHLLPIDVPRLAVAGTAAPSRRSCRGYSLKLMTGCSLAWPGRGLSRSLSGSGEGHRKQSGRSTHSIGCDNWTSLSRRCREGARGPFTCNW